MDQVILISQDLVRIPIDKQTALRSVMLSNLLQDVSDVTDIPITNVDSKTLVKITEYMKHHKDDPEYNTEQPPEPSDWDQQYLETDLETLFSIILGANYLDIKPLLVLVCTRVASILKLKSVEELREIFQVEDDFDDETRKQIELYYLVT
jgi:S-phase kinase-associated protein 1